MMKTIRMPKDSFTKLADERELRCPNATYILINGAERDTRDTAFSPPIVSWAASMRGVHWGTLPTREMGCGSISQLRTDSPPTP